MALVNRKTTLGLTQEAQNKIDLLTKSSAFDIPVVKRLKEEQLQLRKTNLYKAPLRTGGLAESYSNLVGEAPPVAPLATRDTVQYTPPDIYLTNEVGDNITNEQGSNLSINP